ncbi:MAG: GGDEF domain-containing protein [Eubacterium sp.]|nr:GGDEF domain-containing protein [Eubacterium sp.]
MLGYLGMADQSDVIGKRADELGTFINPGEVAYGTKRVLDHGEILNFSPIAVTGGVGRRIPVTEFPWYSGNQIAGVAGWIHIGEAKEEQNFTQDTFTGMMNDYGALLAGSTFDQALREENEDYVIVLFFVHDFSRLVKPFGPEFSQRVVSTIADLIRQENLPEEIVQAHLKGGRFLLLGKEKLAERMKNAADNILEKSGKIRKIYGVEANLEIDTAIGEGSEVDGFSELLQLLQQRIVSKDTSITIQESFRAHQDIQFSPAILDDASEHICLIDPENDEMVYMNNTMKRALNLPLDYKFHGRKCYELLQKRTSPCPDCNVRFLPSDTVVSRHENFGPDGKEFVTREMLVHWKGRLLHLDVGFTNDGDFARFENMLNNETWANKAITSGIMEKDPSEGVQKMVDSVGLGLRSEHTLIFEERQDGTASCTYEWCSPDYPPVRNELQSVIIEKLRPLYRMFETNKVVMISDYQAFLREHSDFWLPGENIRNAISGHIRNSGKSFGFTLVLNALDQEFYKEGYVLSALTDFVAVMMQNRNNIQEALERSMRDPMTGVLNRAGLANYLKSRKRQGTAAVFSTDINGLKVLNDHQGHLAGDHLIHTISDILVSVSDKDHVFRMGGDEFLMIRQGMDETAADDLIIRIREICRVKGVSMAIGYTIHAGGINDMDEILREADKAMYEDKGRYYHRRSTDR